MSKRKVSEEMDLPTCKKRIEVLWELGDRNEVWWRAEVMTIVKVLKGDIHATGSIQYDARAEYDAQTCAVDFLSGNLMRPKLTVSRARRREAVQEMSWRFACDKEKTIDEDRDWEPSTRKRKVALRSQTPVTEREHRTEDIVVVRGVPERSSLPEKDSPQLANMQRCMDECIRKVAQFEKELQLISATQVQRGRTGRVESLKCFIRRSMLHKMQRPLRRASTGTDVQEGGQTIGYVSAAADCSLSDFSLLAGDIASTAYNVSYFPSLPATQQPSNATTSLSVSFDSFQQFCEWLQILEYDDREAMLYKEGGSPNGRDNIIRVLGTSFENDSGFFYLIGKGLSQVSRPDMKVLHRRSTEWDSENDKYVDKLCELNTHIPPMAGIMQNDGVDQLRQSSFQLVWRKDAVLSQRLWTADACSDGPGLVGTVQVTLPAIFFYGYNNCLEMSTALSPSFCKEVV